jgi:hypothetical protein
VILNRADIAKQVIEIEGGKQNQNKKGLTRKHLKLITTNGKSSAFGVTTRYTESSTHDCFDNQSLTNGGPNRSN